MILKHTFTPLNNSRLAHLCGPTDEHLRTIERELEVRIAHRHEQFKVEGAKAKAQRALEILQALYEIAGRPIAASTAGRVSTMRCTELRSSASTALATAR